MDDEKPRADRPQPAEDEPGAQAEDESQRQPVEEDLCDIEPAWDPEAEEHALPETPARDDASTRLP